MLLDEKILIGPCDWTFKKEENKSDSNLQIHFFLFYFLNHLTLIEILIINLIVLKRTLILLNY